MHLNTELTKVAAEILSKPEKIDLIRNYSRTEIHTNIANLKIRILFYFLPSAP